MINENGELINVPQATLPKIEYIEKIAENYDIDKNINDFVDELTNFSKILSELEYDENIEKPLTKQKTIINKVIKDIQDKYKIGIEPLQKAMEEKDNAKKSIVAYLQNIKTEIDNILGPKKEAIKASCFLAIKSYVENTLNNLEIKQRFRNNINPLSLEKYATQTNYNKNTGGLTGPAKDKINNEIINPIQQQQNLYNTRLMLLEQQNQQYHKNIDNPIEEKDIEDFLLEKDMDIFDEKLNNIFDRFVQKKQMRIAKEQEMIKKQEEELERQKQKAEIEKLKQEGEIERLKQERQKQEEQRVIELQKQKESLIEQIKQGIVMLKQEYSVDVDTNTNYDLLDNQTLSQEKNKIYSRIDEEITTIKQKQLQKEIEEKKKQEDAIKLPIIMEIKEYQNKHSYIPNLQNLTEVNKNTNFTNKKINELNINELQLTLNNINTLIHNYNNGLRKFCIHFDDLHLDIEKPIEKIGRYFTLEQETNEVIKKQMLKLNCDIILY